MEDINITIGQAVRFYRTSCGMSMETLGRAMKPSCCGQQIQKYEKGVNRLRVDQLIDISRILDVDMLDLVNRGRAANGMGEAAWAAENIRARYMKLSPTGQKLVGLFFDGIEKI